VYVASETGHALVAISNGQTRTLSSLTKADDVLWLNGLLYVTDLTALGLFAVDPSTGAMRTLVRSSPEPQGLIALGDGTLLLVDTTARVMVRVTPCH
jgi:hypothetical protein